MTYTELADICFPSESAPKACYHIHNSSNRRYYPQNSSISQFDGWFTRKGKLYVTEVDDLTVLVRGDLRIIPDFGNSECIPYCIAVDLTDFTMLPYYTIRSFLKWRVQETTGLILPNDVFPNDLDITNRINLFNMLRKREKK